MNNLLQQGDFQKKNMTATTFNIKTSRMNWPHLYKVKSAPGRQT